MGFSYTTLGYIFNAIAILLFIGTIGYSSYLIQNKKKLDSNRFALEVFTPNTIALFLFAIGSWIIITDSIKNGIDEPFFIKIISATAVGGIILNYFAIILSYLVVYWKA